MNVFVLCTGRCGSVTFAAAAGHISNFTAGHETHAAMLGADRLDYPPRHIEADNRLCWFLELVGRDYGPRAHYVHLVRDPEAVARSFADRWGTGIIRAYHRDLLMAPESEPLAVCRDYVDTVTAKIDAFLADKPHRMTFRIEHAADDWPTFWRWIGANGDLDASLAEWTVRHNEGPPPPPPRKPLAQRLYAFTRRGERARL
jgi:hypothetical protein